MKQSNSYINKFFRPVALSRFGRGRRRKKEPQSSDDRRRFCYL